MGNRRGHTIIEILVTCSLFSLAVFLIFGLWDVGRQLFVMNQTQSDAQRQALKLMNLFSRETLDAPWASVTTTYLSGDPAQKDLAISLLTARDANGNSMATANYRPLYQAWLVYYYDSPSKTVRRARQTLAAPTLELNALAPSDFASTISGSDSRGIIANVLGWQALDYNTGVPTTLSQNPARYGVIITTTQNVPVTVEFRNQFVH